MVTSPRHSHKISSGYRACKIEGRREWEQQIRAMTLMSCSERSVRLHCLCNGRGCFDALAFELLHLLGLLPVVLGILCGQYGDPSECSRPSELLMKPEIGPRTLSCSPATEIQTGPSLAHGLGIRQRLGSSSVKLYSTDSVCFPR